MDGSATVEPFQHRGNHKINTLVNEMEAATATVTAVTAAAAAATTPKQIIWRADDTIFSYL